MGLDRNVYLDAFIKIPIQYEAYEQTIKSCGKHENHALDIKDLENKLKTKLTVQFGFVYEIK